MHLNNSKSCADELDMIHFDKIYDMVNKAARREYIKEKIKDMRRNQRETNEDAFKIKQLYVKLIS